MAILPTSGRTALAIAVMAQPLHLAWGTGDILWDSDQAGGQFVFTTDLIILPTNSATVSAVVVRSGATPYVLGTDYTATADGVVSRLPGGTIAPGATVTIDYHLGRPAEDMDAAALLAEIGRRTVSLKQYVVPAVAGAIVLPEGRFDVSLTPTHQIHVLFNFDYSDAPAAIIRELAVVLGTVVKDTVPSGQVYLLPTDIDSPGYLLALQNIAPITRSAAVRQSFEFVLTL